MSESMYKEENNNISYIEHVKKKQSKKCIDWRQLETPRWLEELFFISIKIRSAIKLPHFL